MSEQIDSGVMLVDYEEQLYLPCIVDENGRFLYTWGYPVSITEAKKRATAELELQMWLRSRTEEEKLGLNKFSK